MNNELILVHKDEYMQLANAAFTLTCMVGSLSCTALELPPNRGSKQLAEKAMEYMDGSKAIMADFGFDLDEFLPSRKMFQRQMLEDYTLQPEEAGYFSDDCQCGMKCCDFADKLDGHTWEDAAEDDAEEPAVQEEAPEKEKAAPEADMDSLIRSFAQVLRQLFGGNLSIEIVSV